jgi:hypothetical protein
LLVIAQTQAVHEEIANTLAAIRRGKQFAQENQAAPEQMAGGRMGGGYGEGMMGMGYGRGSARGGYGYGGYGRGGEYGGEGEFGRGAPTAEAGDADPFGASPEESKKALEERRMIEQERAQSEESKEPADEDPFSE